MVELCGLDERVERRSPALGARRLLSAAGSSGHVGVSVGVGDGGAPWLQSSGRRISPGCREARAIDTCPLLGCREAHVCGRAGQVGFLSAYECACDTGRSGDGRRGTGAGWAHREGPVDRAVLDLFPPLLAFGAEQGWRGRPVPGDAWTVASNVGPWPYDVGRN